MSPRYGINDLDWAEVGELNQQGYIEDPDLEDSPVIFDDQFEQRSREIARQPNGIQPVTVFPSKQGPWSNNPQLGIEQAFAPDANNRQTIIKLDEWGFPEVWSVMLGMSYSDDAWPPGALGFACTATVNAGVGGITQVIEVDWVQGTTFSLPMNALNVIAEYKDFQNIPTDLRLSASLCKGKLAGRPPTRTFELGPLVNPGGGVFSVPIRIPLFARSVMIFDQINLGAARSVYLSTTHLILQRNNNAGASSCTFVNGDTLLNFASNGYPIPDGARYFIVSVDGAQPSAQPVVVFFLGL